MPPSKTAPVSNKNVQKQQKKIIEDKTFGLKNKKGKKVQNIVKQVQNQVNSNPAFRDLQAQAEKKKKAKEEEERKLREIELLMKPVASDKKDTLDKPAAGEEGKKAPCPYFKIGKCNKGIKCKLSHNPEDATENGKRNIYVDYRENVQTVGDEKSEGADISEMSQEDLEKLIEQKHGPSANRTEIVCKFFLDAVERNLYGWFWQCPNGGDKCIYRHALPPGYVLKRDRTKNKKVVEISMEDYVETERFKLGLNLTPVTFETFTAWKKRKLAEKKRLLQDELDKKHKEMSQRSVGDGNATDGSKVLITGRDLFSFNSSMNDENLADAGGAVEDNAQIMTIDKDCGEGDGDPVDAGPIADLNNVENFLSQKKQVADYKCTIASSLNPKLREQSIDDLSDNDGVEPEQTETVLQELDANGGEETDDVIELVEDMSLFESK